MTDAPENPPAFPQMEFAKVGTVECGAVEHPGLSMRDWFAGQAMAWMVYRFVAVEDLRQEWAKDCYAMADAMLRAREGKG